VAGEKAAISFESWIDEMTEQETRCNLIKSLREISPMPNDEVLTEALLIRHEEIIKSLRPIANQDCIEPLIASFGYGDAFEGYWPVVHLLESLPGHALHKALLRALVEGSDGARMWSAFMLGRQREENDVGALVKAIDDSCELVRANVVISLGAIGSRDALMAVFGKAQDPSPRVRGCVAEVMKKLDE
jgi:hypothetical protein